MTLGATEVLNLLDKIVEDFGPDYEIEQCQYFKQEFDWDGDPVEEEGNPAPVCIVGQVLNRLGLPFPNDNGDSWESVKYTRAEYEFDDEANEILNDAQRAQDGRAIGHDDSGAIVYAGKNWGAAVEYAKRHHEARKEYV